MSNPTFIVYCGCMASSKTSSLLLEIERRRFQKKNVAVFKAAIDDRYSVDKIVSHAGWSSPALPVATGSDLVSALMAMKETPDVIALDEAFMVKDCAEVLIWLFKQGFDVLVSSLDISATGQPFPELKAMLPWATHVHKCTAVCTVCGADAYYTHKKPVDVDKGEIHVGGLELYEPRCFTHHGIINQSTAKKVASK